MKNLVFVLLSVLLLAACQPEDSSCVGDSTRIPEKLKYNRVEVVGISYTTGSREEKKLFTKEFIKAVQEVESGSCKYAAKYSHIEYRDSETNATLGTTSLE